MIQLLARTIANTKVRATRRLPIAVNLTTALIAKASEQETVAVNINVNM